MPASVYKHKHVYLLPNFPLPVRPFYVTSFRALMLNPEKRRQVWAHVQPNSLTDTHLGSFLVGSVMILGLIDCRAHQANNPHPALHIHIHFKT